MSDEKQEIVSEVQRFNPLHITRTLGGGKTTKSFKMDGNENGQWIKYTDYAALKAKLTAADARARSAEAELSRYASIEEKSHLQTIDERDSAEESLSHAYYLITGNSPQWSNLFGYTEALEDVDDAQRCLRAEIKQLEAERDAAIELAAWKPIHPESLPRIGDEVGRSVTHGYDVGPLKVKWEVASEADPLHYTHYRAINPPSIVADTLQKNQRHGAGDISQSSGSVR